MSWCVSHCVSTLFNIVVSFTPTFCSTSMFVVWELPTNSPHYYVASHFKSIDFVVDCFWISKVSYPYDTIEHTWHIIILILVFMLMLLLRMVAFSRSQSSFRLSVCYVFLHCHGFSVVVPRFLPCLTCIWLLGVRISMHVLTIINTKSYGLEMAQWNNDCW